MSSLDRVLWPEVGFTTAHLLDYWVKVAPALLPHLRGRPLRAAVAAGSADALWFGPDDVVDRVRDHGDLFAGALAGDQRLPTG